MLFECRMAVEPGVGGVGGNDRSRRQAKDCEVDGVSVRRLGRQRRAGRQRQRRRGGERADEDVQRGGGEGEKGEKGGDNIRERIGYKSRDGERRETERQSPLSLSLSGYGYEYGYGYGCAGLCIVYTNLLHFTFTTYPRSGSIHPATCR